MLGGLVAGIIGAIMAPQSFQDLLNSVNQYNRDKVSDFD